MTEEQSLELQVRPTVRRPLVSYEHLVQMNSKNMKRLNVRCGQTILAIGVKKVIFKVFEEGKIIEKERQLSITAIVHQPDDNLSDNEIRMDQTLRNALGIAAILKGDERVIVRRFERQRPHILTLLLKKILGTQDEIVRVHPSDIPYMEKGVCATEKRLMDVIGAELGDYIELIKGNNSISLRTVELTEEMKSYREKQSKENPVRFPPCLECLKMEPPDLPWLFIDLHSREALGVQLCDPIIIRRDVRHIFYKNLTPFAMVILVTLMGAALNVTDILLKIILFIISSGIALAMIFYQMRKKLVP